MEIVLKYISDISDVFSIVIYSLPKNKRKSASKILAVVFGRIIDIRAYQFGHFFHFVTSYNKQKALTDNLLPVS